MTVLDAPEIRGKLGRLRDAAAKAEVVEPRAVERERALINDQAARLDRSVETGELTLPRAVRRLEVQMDLTLGLLGGIGGQAPLPGPIAPEIGRRPEVRLPVAPPARPRPPPPPPPREIRPPAAGEEAYPSRLPTGIQALRPDQLESVERLLQRKKGSVTLPTGCHQRGQRVIMYDGRTKAVEEIQVGDLLMGPDSQSRMVLELRGGIGPLVEIIPNRAKPFVVNDEHILSLVRVVEHTRGLYPSDFLGGSKVNVSVREWQGWPANRKHIHKLYRVGVEFPSRAELPIDPYFVGLLLGDGGLRDRVNITTASPEILPTIRREAARYGLHIREEPAGKAKTYNLATERFGRNRLRDALAHLGLDGTVSDTKFIPWIYKVSSRRDRLELLAGLIDTDGSLDRRKPVFEYVTKSLRLAEDVFFLVGSLGFYVSIAPTIKQDQYGHKGLYYRMIITGNLDVVPTRIEYKRAGPRRQKKDPLRTGFTVRPCGEGCFYGFTLSGDGLYLLDDFVVTHNSGKTAMSFELIRRIRKPTAFLVPTIALLNQTEKELRAWGVTRPGVFFGDKKELAPVTVFTYQDGILNPDVVRKFPVLIFDEADMAGAPQWSSLLDLARTSEYALGMTATLERGRPNDDRVLSILPLLFDLEVREAIEKGILAPTEVVPVQAALTTEEQENYDVMSHKRSQLWSRFGAHARFEDIRRAAEQGDPAAKQILKLNFQIKQLLAGAADKFGLVLDIARRHPGERIMLFSETIDSIEQVCTWLRTNGLRCETYHSDKKDRERVRVLNEWGKTFEVLLAVSALNRGYNVPEVAVGIIIASSTRKATIIQRIGRIIRARPGKVARIYVVHVPKTGEERVLEEVRRAVELS